MRKKILMITAIFAGAATILILLGWGILPRNRSATVYAQSDSNVNVNPLIVPANSTPRTSLKVTKNQLTAEIIEYDLNPDYPTITICTDLPSVADWLPIFSASLNGKNITVWQVMLIDPEGTAPEKKKRCYLAMLEEGIFQPNLSGNLNFKLEHFQMSIPERLPDELIAKAKKDLREMGLDIDFEMKDVDHGQEVVIKSKPATYSDEQTYQAIQEAIAKAPDKVYGPWEFVIEVKPKQ